LLGYSRIESNLNEIRRSIVQGTKSKILSKQDRQPVHDLASFVQDLYIAAEFKKPVATVIDKQEIDSIHRIFRDDMAIVLEALLGAVHA